MGFTRRMMSRIGFGVGLSPEKSAGGLCHIGGGIHAHCGAQSERAASVGSAGSLIAGRALGEPCRQLLRSRSNSASSCWMRASAWSAPD